MDYFVECEVTIWRRREIYI